MDSFKVICKAEGGWESSPRPTKIVTVSRLFGLINYTKAVSDPNVVPGPVKDEICLVTDTYTSKEFTYYILAGYPHGGYLSKYFIRLDEFMETNEATVEHSEPSRLYV